MKISRRFFVSTTALVMLNPINAWAATCNSGNFSSKEFNPQPTPDSNKKVDAFFNSKGAITTGAVLGATAVGLLIIGGVLAPPTIAVGLGLVAAGAVAGAITPPVGWKISKALSKPSVNGFKSAVPSLSMSDGCFL